MRKKVSTVVDKTTFYLIKYLSLIYDKSISEIVRESLAYYLSKVIGNMKDDDVNNAIEFIANELNLLDNEREHVKNILKNVYSSDQTIKKFIKKAPLMDEIITGVILEEIGGDDDEGSNNF